MLTAGDIQFEPSAGTKIFQFTHSIFAMSSDDAALQAQITEEVQVEIGILIEKEPHNWLLVKNVADVYIKQYNIIRNKRAEDAILSPLFLDRNSFVANQRSLSDQSTNNISREPLAKLSAVGRA
jgi:hypothetical protein